MRWNANVIKAPFGQKLQNIYFFSRVPTHHNFTFNLKFLYNLKNSVQLSKIVCMIFYFWFGPVFMEGCIFVQLKEWTLSLSKVIIRFKIKINRKSTHSFASRTLIFKLQQEVWKFNDNYMSWSSPKTTLKMNFLDLENSIFEYFSFFLQ